jgi:hypothetical protein
MSAKDNISPDQLDYDRNIVGQVTAHLPQRRKEDDSYGRIGAQSVQRQASGRVRSPMYHGTSHEITNGQVEPSEALVL